MNKFRIVALSLILLAIAVISASLPVHDAAPDLKLGDSATSSSVVIVDEPDYYMYDIHENNEATLTKYSGSSAKITVPAVIEVDKRYRVTAIGSMAFADNKTVKSIVLESSSIALENLAFANCQSLESITFKGMVEKIDQKAFAMCTNLKSISMLTDGTINIGLGAFSSCKSLETVKITGRIDTIGVGAFSDCSSLESIILPKNIREISDAAFSYCSSLKEFNVDKVEIIGNSAFKDCKKMEKFVIEGYVEVKSIGENAFYGCFTDARDPYIRIPVSTQEQLEKSALLKSPAKIHLVIPDGIMVVTESAFRNIGNLESVEFSDTVKSIMDHAFEGDFITSVKFPESLTYIGNCAFMDTDIRSLILPSKLEIIGTQAFANMRSLESVSIPQSVIQIGDAAFANAGNLREIYFMSTESLPMMPQITEYNEQAVFYNSGIRENQPAVKMIYLRDGLSDAGVLADQIPADVFKVDYVDNYCVTFDSNGGSVDAAFVFVDYGDKVSEPQTPQKGGYEFKGWYDGTKPYDFNERVEEDITLTAAWEKSSSSKLAPDYNVYYVAAIILVVALVALALFFYRRGSKKG